MHFLRIFPLAALLLPSLCSLQAQAQQAANPPLPDIHQLMKEVDEHQKQLDKVRENYTFSMSQEIQELDAKGQVSKTETKEAEVFFVNSHEIWRVVKKDGKPLTDEEEKKETGRVTKQVEKAETITPGQPLQGQAISVSRLLDLREVRNPRRENYRGRPSIVFDFIGRKDAKTHGLAEDASKKVQGTMWVDEADREVAHLEVSFMDNFNVDGGLLARIEKGSRASFDQELVNGEIWLPTGGEGTLHARVLLFKGIRQHATERDYDFKQFHVEAQQLKDAKAVPESKP